MLSSVKLKISQKIRKLRNKLSILFNRNKGGVLIEFTFSIPICIMVLFFASDHYRFYELRNKVQTSVYLMASLLQNLTNTSEDKYLDITDIRRIAFASCLNFFHTTSMFSPWRFGLSWYGTITYVKRTGPSKYQAYKFEFDTGVNTSTTVNGISCVKTVISVNDPSTLNKDMVLDNVNDEKVLIEASYKPKPTEDGQGTDTRFHKAKLGLYILNAKDGNFRSRIVITPKPGLFSSTH
ncbi:MAG: hypothetical protein IJ730_01225 [Alphaproteobacteria bacterium]|nr:hypothetical protein [Alphaproteobacteria bacterium]